MLRGTEHFEAIDRYGLDSPDIRFGMGAIRNVGENVVAGIVAAREAKGAFTDFTDFMDKVPLHVAGRNLEGEVHVSSPRGDTVTRTFPLRVRVVGEDWLMEGMSADVQLPVGEITTCLLVPRDAVLQTAAGPEIVLALEGKAVRRAARVIGFNDQSFGVEAEGLVAGSQVVTKGQERLRDGQEIAIEP